jgi:hypothetical protein
MPPADNTDVLRKAARKRSHDARAKAEQAITAAGRKTGPVSVAAISRTAGVSRSWLYTQSDLIAAIAELQQRRPSAASTGRQPASDASLQQRLETALARNKTLREEVAELTRRLEVAHGEIRRLRTGNAASSPTLSGPC